MKTKETLWDAIKYAIAIAITICLLFMVQSKELQMKVFIWRHGEDIVQAYNDNTRPPFLSKNVLSCTYESDVKVYEFVFSNPVENDDLYGFYYCADDIPFAYHGLPATLNPVSNQKWEWETDKIKGITKKYKNGWYFFKGIQSSNNPMG